MKIKSAIKYQFLELRWSIVIYYFVMICVTVFGFMSVLLFNGTDESRTVMSSSIEMSSAIFILVAGLNSFKENFGMFLQNGLSRRSMFFGALASFAIISLLMGIGGEILSGLGYGLQSILDSDRFEFISLYAMNYADRTGFQAIFESILMNSTVYYAVFLIGFFITIAYYRMSKTLKLIVSIGVPGSLMLLLPILDYGILNGAITRGFEKILWGILKEIAQSPYVVVAISMSAAIVFGGLCWLLIRKAIVK